MAFCCKLSYRGCRTRPAMSKFGVGAVKNPVWGTRRGGNGPRLDLNFGVTVLGTPLGHCKASEGDSGQPGGHSKNVYTKNCTKLYWPAPREGAPAGARGASNSPKLHQAILEGPPKAISLSTPQSLLRRPHGWAQQARLGTTFRVSMHNHRLPCTEPFFFAGFT